MQNQQRRVMRFGVAGNGVPHRPGKVAVLDFAYRTPP